jgi:hypothetical protein
VSSLLMRFKAIVTVVCVGSRVSSLETVSGCSRVSDEAIYLGSVRHGWNAGEEHRWRWRCCVVTDDDKEQEAGGRKRAKRTGGP